MKISLIAPLALGAALFVTAPANAQTSPTNEQSTPSAQQMPPGPGSARGMGPGMRRGMMRGRGMGQGHCNSMGGMGMGGGMAMMRYPDGTLAFLKTELKIKDSQSKQWDAFAHALRISAEATQKMRAQHWANRQPLSLKAWLQRREDGAAMRLEMMRHMSKALIPLYDSLDATQKKTADTLFMPCSSREMGRGMGWQSQPADNDDE